VLYELTTGRRCFYAPGEFALINRVVEGKYDRPSKVREGFPAALEEIIVRALQGDREERFSTARDLQLALESFAMTHGIRLSSVTLSTFMGGTFGHEDYPQTGELLPALTPVRGPTQPSLGEALDNTSARRRSARRALPAVLFAGGVGAVIGIGIGVMMTLGPTVAPPADDAAPTSARESVDDPAAIVAADLDRAVERDPEAATLDTEAEHPEEASADVIVIDPDEDPAAKPRAGATRRAKRSSTRPRAARRELPPGDVGYLPPSRRK
jgi:serine/threonine-protein kinase